MKRKKPRKQKQFMALLLAMLLVLNMFLPASSISSLAGNEVSKALNENLYENDPVESPDEDELDEENPGENEPGKENPGENEPDKENPGENEPGKENPGENEPGKENSGENEPGKENPGEDEPGKENPGENEPGKENPGEDEPGKENPGEDEPEVPGESDTNVPKGDQETIPPVVSGTTLIGDIPVIDLFNTRVPNDMTDWLKDYLKIEIYQGTTPIEKGGKIDINDPFEVRGKFIKSIPLQAPLDDGDYLVIGDWMTYEMPADLSPLFSEPVRMSGDHGQVEFHNGENEEQPYVKILFDQWDQDDTELNSVTFSARFKYNANLEPSEEPETVEIFGETYQIYKPERKIIPTVSKNAQLQKDNKEIKWTVTVGAKKENGTAQESLYGFVFTDDISSVGELVDGKFTVGTEDQTVSTGTTTLTYIFGDVTGPINITYVTKAPAGSEISSTPTPVTNTAWFGPNDKQIKGEKTIKIPVTTWIDKTGEVSGTLNDTVTWYIKVNKSRHNLTNVTITDELEDNLILVSAKWYYNASESGEGQWIEDTSNPITITTPDPQTTFTYPGGQDGKTDKYLRLALTTRLKTPEEGYIKDSDGKANNTASVSWEELGNKGPYTKAAPEVGVGYDVLTKNGEVNSNWSENHLIDWTVKLDFKNQFTSDEETDRLKDFTVYDLIVHGNDGSFDNTKDYTYKKANGDSPVIISKDKIIQKLTPRYQQRYESQEKSVTGYNLTHIKVYDGETYIADLLMIEPTAQTCTAQFSTKMLNYQDFLTEGSKSVTNDADLFETNSGNILHRKNATKTVYPNVKMLDKAVVNRAETTLDGNVSNGTSSNGFNYVDKTAIFKLTINETGQNWSDAEYNYNDPFIITDKLPVGWVFDKTFNNNKGYMIFEKGSATELTADSNPVDPVINKASFTPVGDESDTIDFTFDTLNKAYVILIKAKLPDNVYYDYMQNNTTSNPVKPQNTVTFKTGDTTYNKQADVEVNTGVVHKTVEEKTPANKDGVVQWTIDYNPLISKIITDSGSDEIIITDDLTDKNFELRIKSDGTLNITDDNFFVEDMRLTLNGGLESLASPENLAETWYSAGKIKYDISERKLIITLTKEEGKKPYRIKYLTDLTGPANQTVKNGVTVSGVKVTKNDSEAGVKIFEADATASAKSGGYLRIWKYKSNTTTSVPGATFELYTDKGVLFRRGTTLADGLLRFGALPEGKYTLIESGTPNGYVRNPKVYQVEVKNKNPFNQSEGKETIISYEGAELKKFDPTNANNNAWKFDVSNTPYSEDAVGELHITKIFEGRNPIPGDVFEFEITIGSKGDQYFYTVEGETENKSFVSGETIVLKSGDTIVIKDIPVNTAYEIEEKGYAEKGYTLDIEGADKGTIVKGTKNVTFTNMRTLPGDLLIIKTVSGNGKDESKPFEFHIEFDATGIYNGIYKSSKGEETISVYSGMLFTLAHKESLTIVGLPHETIYRIWEVLKPEERYTTEKPDRTGKIDANSPNSETFMNVHTNPGALTIYKTVDGTGADKTKKFEFTVNFTALGRYPYSGSGIAEGATITSGEKIYLADGESVTITGLPDNTSYEVKETDYSSERYTTTVTDGTGVIIPDTVANVRFKNTYSKPSTGGGGNGGGGPKPPTTPTQPTEPVLPTPQEPVNPGETPRGHVQGPDGNYYTPQEFYDIFGQVPLGYIVGPNGMLIPLGGLPKTGDDASRTVTILGLLSMSALLGIAVSVRNLRKKRSGE